MTTDSGTPAATPYVSFRTVLNLLDRLHEGGIPQRIDRSYWSTFLAGGLGGQLMVALRWLGLVDSVAGEPTSALERIVNPAGRKAALAELLRERYSAVFENVDLARTTPGHLDETFRKEFKVASDTLRKSVTFFVYAAQYADIPVSNHIAGKTRRAPGSGKRAGTPKQSGTRRPRQTTKEEPEESPPPPLERETTREITQTVMFQGGGIRAHQLLRLSLQDRRG